MRKTNLNYTEKNECGVGYRGVSEREHGLNSLRSFAYGGEYWNVGMMGLKKTGFKAPIIALIYLC